MTYFSRITPVKKHNPVLSASQFANLTNDPDVGGATMDAHTYTVAEPGHQAYFVGGEKDDKGERIPTHTVPGPLDAMSVLQETHRVQKMSGSPRVALGSWHNDDGSVDMDASAGYKSQEGSLVVAARRGETAVWDMRRMRELRPQARHYKKAGVPVPE